MNDLTELIERNRSFATDFDGGELPIAPRFRQVILSCADSRIDPTHFFSLEPGDAVVLRSLGGRLTQGGRRAARSTHRVRRCHDGPRNTQSRDHDRAPHRLRTGTPC